MQLAHFQVARSGDDWVVRFEDNDYPQPSRDRAIAVATQLATKIARLEVEATVFIEPIEGERWLEWRPHQQLPEVAVLQRRSVARPVGNVPVPHLRLISNG